MRVLRVVILTAILLLVGTTAVAQPPRPGLCVGRTGDRLTRCLYSDLDDRLRKLEPTSPPTTQPPTTQPPTTQPPTTQPPTSPPTTAPPITGDWLSGAAGGEAANGSFGTWRGSPVEIGETWVNDPALYTLAPKIAGCDNCGEWNAWRGPMSVSAAPASWNGWASEANGGNDAFWTAMGKNLKTQRDGRGTTYVAPYYEFNGDWMTYSVPRTAQGMADFVRGFSRTVATLRREFPAIKIVLPTAAGRTMPNEMWPSPAAFDVVGIDLYNEWPWCGTDSCLQSNFLTRITPLQSAAAARGKTIAFPEWGNSSVAAAGGGGGGESPALMSVFHDWLATNSGTSAGKVVYETYFNIGGYPARYELFTGGRVNSTQTQTAAAYVAKF